jgi:hypothetical protein
VRNTAAILLFAFALLAPAAWPQSGPERGGNEVQVWTGGGHGLSGSTSDTGVWNVGVRYGWVLTNPHGPGFLRGRFEYAVDVVPVFLVFQPAGTAYGFGLNPLGLKWNMEAHRVSLSSSMRRRRRRQGIPLHPGIQARYPKSPIDQLFSHIHLPDEPRRQFLRDFLYA